MQHQDRVSADAHSILSLLEDGLDTLALGVGVFDSDLRLIECNRLFRKIRGYPDDLCGPGAGLRDLLNHDLSRGQLVDDDSDDPVGSWLDRAAKNHRHSVETELEDGRIVAMAIAPIGDHGVVLTFSDITERSRAERSLRAKQEWLDLVTEATSEGIYDWNVGTSDLTVSYRLTAMLGLSPGDLTASDWNERIHVDDFDLYRETITKHFKGETPRFECEYRMRRESGEYIWFADSGKCVRDETGRAKRLVGAVSDITARRLVEAALEKSEERYALATEAATEGLYDWDVAADSLIVSERLNAILALPMDALNALEWNERVHPDDLEKYSSAMRAHFKGGTRYLTCEYRIQNGAGNYIWVSDNSTSVRDSEGRVIRLVGAISDISARKAAEREVLLANSALDEKNQELEALSAKLAKYLSKQVYDSIFSGRKDVRVESYRKTLTVFFSDIQGFTDLTDSMEAEPLSDLLNGYLSEMSSIGHEYGGTIDKFIGDGIMIFFGDPDSKGQKEDALACVRMALAMRQRMYELREEWVDKGVSRPLHVRIGINTGFCTVGNFGSENRLDYTIVGGEVNAAARLETAAEPDQILVSHATYALVQDEIQCQPVGEISVKGIARPLKTYEVVATREGYVSGARTISEIRDGFRLALDPVALPTDDREQAKEVLREALEVLNDLTAND